ncbi:MAG TPA: hypothetical protein VLE99_01425 [Candidatus Saccharimonadales bacterium]|nr:hypothetical protein [Candidatus Saccharimonadales bacterium]
MLLHLIDFLVDYFRNLNVRKITGGILALIGLAILGKMTTSGDTNRAVLYAIGGILVSGVGFIVVYYDIAKDKTRSRYSELDTLTKAHTQNEHEDGKASTWHMNQGPDNKNTPNKD